MSSLTPEEDFNGSLSQILDFVWRQWRKEIYTTLPGVVSAYDATTRRADVQPQIKVVLPKGKGELSRPVIPDVPVVHPSAGGYVIHVPVKEGDNVLLIFTMRDITTFKGTYKESIPYPGILNDMTPVAIPGFGSLEITPVDKDAVVIQHEGNDPYILLKEEKIEMKRGQDKVVMDDGGIELRSSRGITLRAPRVDILRN